MKKMTNHIMELFNSFSTPEAFHRVNPNYKLDVYVGINSFGQYTMTLVSTDKPSRIDSTTYISTKIGQRKDKKWAMSFSLKNDDMLDVFSTICEDLVESSKDCKTEQDGIKFFVSRYNEWIKILKAKKPTILSIMEIKGLIGELTFLKEFLSKKYGLIVAINSWIGSDNADQDFVCSDCWYEVKSTVSGTENVHISSIEQLDTNSDGNLVIVYLDKTSQEDKTRINLNSITEEIVSLLDDDLIIEKFKNNLLKRGYFYSEIYDEYNFKLNGIQKYYVDKSFPCLRKKSLPDSVTNVTYELILNGITNYLEN